MTDREKYLKVLETWKLRISKPTKNQLGYVEGWIHEDDLRALDYAISSIKTDLKYDLMYEGEEIYTKADMLSMLYKLRSEIINMPKYFPYADHTRWFIDGDVFGLIDKQINALKENEDDNK